MMTDTGWSLESHSITVRLKKDTIFFKEKYVSTEFNIIFKLYFLISPHFFNCIKFNFAV